MPDLKKLYENTKKLRDLILSALKSVPDARINSPENALPNIINLSVLGIPSQALINFLAAKGRYVSGGSA